MKTQTMVQQVKTKKNWYHVSSSKMSAKAGESGILHYGFVTVTIHILHPLDTTVIVYLMMIKKLDV